MSTWRDHIAVDPEVCHGRATIEGTRIPVSVVLENLAAGVSTEALLQSYPTLTTASIRAALAYAASLVDD